MTVKYETELKYGLIIGIGVSLWVLIEFALGFHTTRLDIGQYSGYLAIIIPIIALYFGLLDKKKELKKKFTFGEGVKSGFLMSVFAGLLLVLFFLLYALAINPAWVDNALAFEQVKLIENGATPDQAAEIVEGYAPYMSLPAQLLGSFLGTVIQGTVLSLILVTILRPKKVDKKPKTKKRRKKRK